MIDLPWILPLQRVGLGELVKAGDEAVDGPVPRRELVRQFIRSARHADLGVILEVVDCVAAELLGVAAALLEVAHDVALEVADALEDFGLDLILDLWA